MILYLSSTQHTNLLDFTGFYEPESEKVIKKLVGSFILKQFVVYDMRNFSHFTEVVLDRVAFQDTDDEFVQAIREFQTMYSAQITVIYEGLEHSDALFVSLLESGVGNIVCDTEIQGIQQEITECLSEEGMMRYVREMRVEQEKIWGQENPKQYCFGCRDVLIAVAGAQPRIGTTTAAVGLCAWLAKAGASVCYVEANQNGHLEAFVRSYGMEQENDGWMLEGVHYRKTKPQEGFHFVVYDLGSGIDRPDGQNVQRDILKQAGQRLLVCGTKPYELGSSVRLQKEFAGMDAWLLCPFVADGMRSDFKEALEDGYHKVLFLDYQPELTDSGCNAEVYLRIVREYIINR